MPHFARIQGLIAALWGIVACGPKADSLDGADTSEADATIVGVWVGYANGAELDSGSDRVELEVVSVAAEGRIEGVVSFGEPGTLPPATDPDVGYPEGADPIDGFFSQVSLLERFTYRLDGAYDDGSSRLVAELLPSEPWAQWCALQTPYPDAGSCLPPCGFATSDAGCELIDCAEAGPIDCAKLSLCLSAVCHCEPTGCTHALGRSIVLDLHRSGDELEGPIDTMGTAYLTRQ